MIERRNGLLLKMAVVKKIARRRAHTVDPRNIQTWAVGSA
jgi:hypothetical protein